MPVQRISPFDLQDAETYHQMGRPDVKRVLVEGDSWMSMFLPRDGNLVTWLQSRHDVVVLDLSYPGDTLADMASNSQFELFERLTQDARHGWPFDAILLNGGGNDVIHHDLPEILGARNSRRARQKRGVARINETALAGALERVRRNFLKFMDSRNASGLNADCPILTCSYDFVTPRDCPARLLGVPVKGPWIKPRMESVGVDSPNEQKEIADYLLRAFLERVLQSLAEDGQNNFHVLNTQGTLTPARPTDTQSAGDWADEIHPSGQGWSKLAARLGPALDAILDS